MALSNYYEINTSLLKKRNFNVTSNLDTIRVGGNLNPNEERLLGYVLYSMFTDVNINRSKFRLKHKTKLDRKEWNKFKSGYGNCYFYKGNCFLALFKTPRFRKLPNFQITFHQSSIGPVFNTFELFHNVFGKKLAEKIILEWLITRLDLCIDLNVSIKNIIQRIDRPRIQTIDKKIGVRDTYVLGEKCPVQIVIYEKKTKRFDGFNLTRIEKRIFGKNKIPINNLFEIGMLMDICLFKELFFYSFNKKVWDNKTLTNKRIKNFNDLRLEDGFLSAKKKFSINKNFQRIYKHLNECTKLINLDEAFKATFIPNLANAFEFVNNTYSYCYVPSATVETS